MDFNQNFRQSGSYKRCVLEFPDDGWKEKYFQFEQAYKELMIDFLYYSDEIEYEDIFSDLPSRDKHLRINQQGRIVVIY